MKHPRLLCVFLCLLCLSLLPACGSASAPQAANPMVEKASLEEINSAVGCAMKAPAGLTVSDQTYFVISGSIGEYRFTADGKAYTLRAAKTTDDISGIYLEGEALGACADKENTDALFWKEGCWARWFDGEMQYSLFSAQNGTENTNAFLAVCDALK